MAVVHIVRKITHFFFHMKSREAKVLEKLLRKNQDKSVSTCYCEWVSVVMRWTIGHALTVQGQLTKFVNDNGARTVQELRAVSWLISCKKYDQPSES